MTTDVHVEKVRPKRLTAGSPAVALNERVRDWIRDHRATDKVQWDPDRGRYVHEHRRRRKDAWAEVGLHQRLTDFALSVGLIDAREARQIEEASRA